MLVVLLVVAVAAVPTLRARAVGVPATAAALDLTSVRPLAPTVERRELTVGGTLVDRYARDADDPTIVLVPGATPAGRDDERAIRLARALARSGRTVLVPELALYEPTLDPVDVARVARVVEAAAAGGPVVVVGISFGGSLALRAIGDHEGLEQHVALVVVFGAYADIVGVLQGAATGVVLSDGEAVPWEPEAEAETILRRELLATLPGELVPLAEAALAGERPVEELPEPARAVVELLTHEDPARTRSLVARLPDDLRARLHAVSPVHVAAGTDVPVRVLHARDDPAVPLAEGRRLAAVLPDAELTVVAGFDHVDLELDSPRELWSAASSLGRVWWLIGDALAAQEPWAPTTTR